MNGDCDEMFTALKIADQQKEIDRKLIFYTY